MLTKTLLVGSAATALLAAPAVALATGHGVLRALAQEAGSCCQFVPDVDITGSDLTNMKKTSKIDCCEVCLGNANCQAVTWTNYNTGTCWLKTTFAGSATVKLGALTILSSCTPTYVKLNNCGMTGNDLMAVSGSKTDDCFAKCKTLTLCVGWTWSDYNGGTCWLKTAMAPCTSAANKFSGAMGRPGF